MTQQYAKIGLAPDVLAHQLGTDHDTALFVIRAVNSHDDLLAALKGLLTERKSHPAPPDGAAVMVCAGCIEAEQRANAAIAKAEEGS